MDSGLRGVSPARVFARPTADEIWLGPTQQSALSLLSGSARIAGVAGGPASGRSLLLERVRREAIRSGALALDLDRAATDERRALSALLAATGLNASHLGPVDQRNLLHLVLSERLSEGRRVLLFVDDAERLAPPVAAELARLCHFGDRPTRQLEIRFAVNPDANRGGPIADTLAAGERVTLDYLDAAQLQAYVQWRLARQGLPSLFTRTAMLLLWRYVGGTFRGIDSLGRLALLLMQRRRTARVDVQCVNEAALLLTRQRHFSRSSVIAAPEKPRDSGSIPPTSVPDGCFIVTEHGSPIRRVGLARRLLIGRAPTNDVCIAGAEVSRYHALVEASGDRIEIVDLNSANGLRVNGERHRHALLNDRDVVTIGAYKLKLETGIRVAATRSEAAADLSDTVVFPASDRVAGPHLKTV